jgi:hypothetical protein
LEAYRDAQVADLAGEPEPDHSKPSTYREKPIFSSSASSASNSNFNHGAIFDQMRRNMQAKIDKAAMDLKIVEPAEHGGYAGWEARPQAFCESRRQPSPPAHADGVRAEAQ